MKTDVQKLLEMNPNLPDRTVAEMIAAVMMEGHYYARPHDYYFSIEHDIRPPKNAACPVHYDWALKDRVGIKTLHRETARRWIVHALLLKFSVSREGGKPLTCSIERARRRAENHQRPKVDTDDDIPF